jgi:ABC-type antimicrobial peptide transport system permease subunit
MSLQGAIDPQELEALVERGLESARRIPGVVSASVSNAVPIERALNLPLTPPPDARISDIRSVDFRFATADYFDVFHIRVLAGRAFGASDRAGGSPVAIVNESFARGYFGRLNVVGETIGLIQNFSDPPRQIVGVIADVKARSGSGWTRGLTALGSDVAPMMIVPTGQAVTVIANRGRQRVWDLTWSIRSQASLPNLERDMRDAVQAIDARMVFREFEAMTAVVSRDLDVPRLVSTLLTGFALLAIVLATVGLYGLMAYAAAQRAREVGIRMALGATAGEVLKRFLSEGLAVATAGLIVGLIGAASMSRVLTTLLFGVTPLDVETFASVLLVLLVVATLATLLPSFRAARTDPVSALRAD